MGNGKAPADIDLDTLPPIDDGTSARTGSPPPAPIGLDAKSGSATPSRASLAEQIVSYARRRRGARVGDGQCFALVDRALGGAHAKSAKDYGAITPDADYVWGTPVSLADLQPGDVIQFRDYSYDRTVVIDDDRGTKTEEHSEGRPHHSAIVESVDGRGGVTVLEQNSPDGSPVRRTPLFFTAGTTTDGSRTTTITVQGTFWFYRPDAN